MHGPQGPAGWNIALFWPWEDVRMLLTLIPARLKQDKTRSVVLMFRPVHMPPPITNNMGFRTPNMARIKCWMCGPSVADSCPLGERLDGCCSHCSAAVYLCGTLANNPLLFNTRHRNCHILDRANQQQMNEDLASEVIS